MDNWFSKLATSFIPDDIEIGDKTPEGMISIASKKAFSISTLANIPPGPLGMLTVLPEITAVTKVQINMIYRIAKFYDQEEKVNSSIILMIFGKETGLNLNSQIIKTISGNINIRILSERIIKIIAKKIGKSILKRISGRIFGRYMSIVLAPVFGNFSRKMTKRIGQEAINIFSKDFEIEDTTPIDDIKV